MQSFLIINPGTIIVCNKTNTKLLVLGLGRSMEWKTHINLIILRMSSACYVIRSMCSFNVTILCLLPFCNGVWIFWGNSSESMKVFKLQKKTIKIMTGSKSRTTMQTFIPNIKNVNFSISLHTLLDDIFDKHLGTFHL